MALEALHRQVLPFLLRRVKEDVLGDLPPKIIQDYYCYLSPLQVRLYEDFSKTQVKQGIASSIATMASEEVAAAKATAESKGKTTHIFQALQYLRKLCSHPALVLNDQHPEYEAIKKEYGLESLRSLESAPKLQSLKYASFFLCPPPSIASSSFFYLIRSLLRFSRQATPERVRHRHSPGGEGRRRHGAHRYQSQTVPPHRSHLFCVRCT